MDLRVYHPTFAAITVTLPSNRTVLFDANGVSPELTREEYDLLLTCRDFRSVASLMAEMTADAHQDALPLSGEAPEWGRSTLADRFPVQATGDDTWKLTLTVADPEEEVPEHDPDASLLEQFRTCMDCQAFFENLKLTDRLDLASDHRLTETEASLLFTWESAGRKSKRIQNALDRRLLLVRGSKSADKVTANLLSANFPRAEEQ